MGIAQPTPIEVDAVTVAAWLESGEALLIDVREEEEWAAERLDPAILLPMSGFESAQVPEAPGKKIVFYCLKGARSAAIGRKFLAEGKGIAFNLTGGITAWKDSGLPVAR